MNHDLPVTFGVEPDGIDLPRHSFMRLPRQRAPFGRMRLDRFKLPRGDVLCVGPDRSQQGT